AAGALSTASPSAPPGASGSELADVNALFTAPRTPIMSLASAGNPRPDTPMVWKLFAVEGGLVASYRRQVDDTPTAELGVLLDTSAGNAKLKEVAVVTADQQNGDAKALLQLLDGDLDAAAANIPEVDVPSGLDSPIPPDGASSGS